MTAASLKTLTAIAPRGAAWPGEWTSNEAEPPRCAQFSNDIAARTARGDESDPDGSLAISDASVGFARR